MLGFQDECWWSRVTDPTLKTWSPQEEPTRLLAKEVGPGEGPKALACYGLLRADTGEMLVRFLEARPVSAATEVFLAWLCRELTREGKKALLLVWDNASWHKSQRVRAWIRAHNREAKAQGGVRILSCLLPSKSPWLNNIEPKWVHGKKAIVETERVLAPEEVIQRVHDYYDCPITPKISLNDP